MDAPATTADPPWLDALLRDPAVAALGVRPLTPDGRAETTATARDKYGETLSGRVIHSDATLSASHAAFDRGAVAVAVGPDLPGVSWPVSSTDEVSWYLDPGRPDDGLLLALSDEYPPFLWIPAGRTPAAVAAALAEFRPRPASRRLELRRVERGFLCHRGEPLVPNPYSGELDGADFHEIGRHAVMSAFLDTGSWGSSHLDDPWPDPLPEGTGVLSVNAVQSEVGGQAPGRVPAETYRTLRSRSHVSFQAHQRDLLVAEVRFRPSRHPAAVEHANAVLGTDYPVDLPVDAVGILLGFAFVRADEAARRLTAEAAVNPGLAGAFVRVLGALCEGDLGELTARLRPLLRHPAPEVRGAVGNVAIAYNLEFLLHELSLLDALGRIDHHPEIARVTEALLDDGIPPPAPDPGFPDDDEDWDEDEEDAR